MQQRRPNRPEAEANARPAWQIDKIRQVLQSYQEHTVLHDGHGTTWLGIEEAIAEDTGITVAHERIRQFACGIRNRDGTLNYPNLRAESLEAVIRFLTDPDREIVRLEDLEAYDRPFRPPIGLLEFLREGLKDEHHLPPKLDGSYRAENYAEHRLIQVELRIQTYSDKGLYQISETSHVFRRNSESTATNYENVPRKTKFSFGWGFLSPEDNFIVFMKDINDFTNHWWQMQGEPDFWSDVPISAINMLRSEYEVPVLRSREITLMNDVILHDAYLQNLYGFSRLPEKVAGPHEESV